MKQCVVLWLGDVVTWVACTHTHMALRGHAAAHAPRAHERDGGKEAGRGGWMDGWMDGWMHGWMDGSGVAA